MIIPRSAYYKTKSIITIYHENTKGFLWILMSFSKIFPISALISVSELVSDRKWEGLKELEVWV